MTGNHRHPQHEELWTPVTPELLETLNELKRGVGTWRRVAYLTHTRLKVLRNIRKGRRKAVSMRVLDRILSGLGRPDLTETFVWFTADDLVVLGVWKDVQYVEGRERTRRGLSDLPNGDC